MKKCGDIFNKVPAVQKLWETLGDTVKDDDPIFAAITQTLKTILHKNEVVEKGAVQAFEAPVAVDNSMNK